MVSGKENFKQIYTKCSQKYRKEIKKVEIGQKGKETSFGKTEVINWCDEVRTFRKHRKRYWHLM